MGNSIRRQIIDAVTARLAAVTGIVSCHAWRKTPYSPNELPGLLIGDLTDTITAESLEQHNHNLSIEIVLLVSGTTPADRARELAAALLTALGTDDKWSGLAIYSNPETVTMDAETVGDAVVAARININILYHTDRWGM